MKFTEFELNENLQKSLAEAGYINCTPVQEQVLKNFFEGNDLYVQSQTGTGKTCAFLIPMMENICNLKKEAEEKNDYSLRNEAVIILPTRELAVQVEEEAKKLGKYCGLKFASFYGGVGYDNQIQALKKGVDVIIGTPGRIIDLCKGGSMDIKNARFLVLDEADRMFDMGFYPDLRTILTFLGNPEVTKRKTMLFSATLNTYVKNLAAEYTTKPIEITIEAENITVDEIRQELIHVSSDKKLNLLLGIIKKENPESLIIFSNTKKMCETLSRILNANEIPSEFIMGDLPQKKRLAIMNSFKAGKIRCLVATDVAARGIDVNDLQMVINYDLPNEAENYVHRIGRTARAGKTGVAYTLCTEQDVYSLMPIERYIEKQIPSRVAQDCDYAEVKRASFENKDRNKKSQKKSTSQFNKVEHKDSKPSVDLSKMTSEERMKYYKEKYGSGAISSGSPKNASNAQKVSVKHPENKKKHPAVPTENAGGNNSDKNKNKVYNRKDNKNKKKGLNSKGLRGLFHRIFGKK